MISTKSYAKVASQTFFLRHRKKVSRNGPNTIKNGQTIRGKHFYKFAVKIRRTFSGPFFGPFCGHLFTFFPDIFLTNFLGRSLWSQVFGLWSQVFGLKSLVSGLWSQVFGKINMNDMLFYISSHDISHTNII